MLSTEVVIAVIGLISATIGGIVGLLTERFGKSSDRHGSTDVAIIERWEAMVKASQEKDTKIYELLYTISELKVELQLLKGTIKHLESELAAVSIRVTSKNYE
jgi:hypothetical protein